MELKRPSQDIGPTELGQLRSYAYAVAKDERFNQPNVSWDFMIVGNNLVNGVELDATQKDRPVGLVSETGAVRIWAFTWGQIISTAQHRLKFVQQSLEYQSTHESGMRYLHEAHARYLPPSAAASTATAASPVAAPFAPAMPSAR